MSETPWYNRGLFSSLNLRQKTLLTIGLTGLVLLVIFISGTMINSNLPTDFTIKMQPPSFAHIFGTDWMGRDMFERTIKGLSLSIMIGILVNRFIRINTTYIINHDDIYWIRKRCIWCNNGSSIFTLDKLNKSAKSRSTSN